MNSEEYFHQYPYWNDLNDEEKETVSRGTIVRHYHKGAYIYGLEDTCLGMIYVLKGSIRVYISSHEGREVTLFHITKGESCILSASCAIGEISLDVQLTAEIDTDIMAVHAGIYQKIKESNIHVRCFSFELASQRFSSVVWVLQQILFDHFDQRLARFLIWEYEKTGDKSIKMTQEEIAVEVNSAREVVARMLRQFLAQGWIEMSRGSITLMNIEALKSLLM